MHSTVSRFSRKCSNTFGVLKHFLFGLKSNCCGIDPAYRASPTSQCAAHNCRNIAISRTTAGRRICEMKLYDRTPSSGQGSQLGRSGPNLPNSVGMGGEGIRPLPVLCLNANLIAGPQTHDEQNDRC